MDQINYHHLRYFWTVARAGRVGAAASELLMSASTVSTQVKNLETSLGERLFERRGRRLVLTDVGRIVFDYAEEIFALGRELEGVVRQGETAARHRLAVGVTDAVPKLVARDILRPAFELEPAVRIVAREGKAESLVSDLVAHRLDVVLTDSPVPSDAARIFHHELGSCGVSWVAARPLAARLRRGFPGSIERAPVMLPASNTALRRSIDRWLDQRRLRPRVLGEFEDSALMKVVAAERSCLVPVCDIVLDETLSTYRFGLVGAAEDCSERFLLVTAERRIQHPAALAIRAAAREELFGA